ncbi:MAG: ATP-dependent RNA helicase RhlE [uncultured Sulfurimonas sp.]|nr:MAG: ATP-dependent RNA helicase RhlE [uncultured Sulfurimonas sp.]CAI6164323.1 MAG: ATP-dependent RNA helicase RhlE [uncultured Sulfurimonas sp.]
MTFNDLGLNKLLLKAIQEQGYDTPTPIQEKAIPVILQRKDILAGAQTGTGKTAGFTLPMLELLLRAKPEKGNRKVKALVLTPTRELASQVAESIGLYAKHTPFKTSVIFGGVKINPQIVALRKGIDIVVATPGRLLDHISQRTIDLSGVDFLILDEADRMLDMGFVNDIKKVIAVLPKERQTLLFSATYSDAIKKLSASFLKSPSLIEVARTNASSEIVKQAIYHVDKTRKRELLTHLIKEGDWQQVLVFTRTKHGANRLCGQLETDGITSAAIHGNKSQNARTKALADFKAGKTRVLVATDIAARGIDIDQLPHVVNYELPNVSEDYVHRIGRTGRAGNKGEAISLVCVDEDEFLAGIEKLISKDIPKVWLKDFKPDPSIKAEPINMGGNRGARNKPRGGGSRGNGGNRNSSGGGRGRR